MKQLKNKNLLLKFLNNNTCIPIPKNSANTKLNAIIMYLVLQYLDKKKLKYIAKNTNKT